MKIIALSILIGAVSPISWVKEKYKAENFQQKTWNNRFTSVYTENGEQKKEDHHQWNQLELSDNQKRFALSLMGIKLPFHLPLCVLVFGFTRTGLPAMLHKFQEKGFFKDLEEKAALKFKNSSNREDMMILPRNLPVLVQNPPLLKKNF